MGNPKGRLILNETEKVLGIKLMNEDSECIYVLLISKNMEDKLDKCIDNMLSKISKHNITRLSITKRGTKKELIDKIVGRIVEEKIELAEIV